MNFFLFVGISMTCHGSAFYNVGFGVCFVGWMDGVRLKIETLFIAILNPRKPHYGWKKKKTLTKEKNICT